MYLKCYFQFLCSDFIWSRLGPQLQGFASINFIPEIYIAVLNDALKILKFWMTSDSFTSYFSDGSPQIFKRIGFTWEFNISIWDIDADNSLVDKGFFLCWILKIKINYHVTKQLCIVRFFFMKINVINNNTQRFMGYSSYQLWSYDKANNEY